MDDNWDKVLADSIAAAKGVLGSVWNAASQGATAQIKLLVQTAQYVDANKTAMTPDEYQLLVSQQKTALQNVLTAYESIGIAAAINTVNEVLEAIVTDVPTLAAIFV